MKDSREASATVANGSCGEHRSDLAVASLNRKVQRRGTTICGLVELRTSLDEHRHYIGVTVVVGNDQRRPTILLSVVDIRLCLEQLEHYFDVALLRGAAAWHRP